MARVGGAPRPGRRGPLARAKLARVVSFFLARLSLRPSLGQDRPQTPPIMNGNVSNSVCQGKEGGVEGPCSRWDASHIVNRKEPPPRGVRGCHRLPFCVCLSLVIQPPPHLASARAKAASVLPAG